jgi:hypothetical protein
MKNLSNKRHMYIYQSQYRTPGSMFQLDSAVYQVNTRFDGDFRSVQVMDKQLMVEAERDRRVACRRWLFNTCHKRARLAVGCLGRDWQAACHLHFEQSPP